MADPRCPDRRQALATAAALGASAAALALGACSHAGAPRRLLLAEAQLQALLAQRFPRQQRVLEVFEVRAAVPQLRLLPAQNRLAAEVPLQLRERLLQHQWHGRLALATALRWQPSDQTVRLVDVAVQGFNLDDRPLADPLPPPRGVATAAAAADEPAPGASPGRRTLQRLGAALAAQWLDGQVLWQLTEPERARLAAAGLVPGTLTVTDQGLEITLVPGRF